MTERRRYEPSLEVRRAHPDPRVRFLLAYKLPLCLAVWLVLGLIQDLVLCRQAGEFALLSGPPWDPLEAPLVWLAQWWSVVAPCLVLSLYAGLRGYFVTLRAALDDPSRASLRRWAWVPVLVLLLGCQALGIAGLAVARRRVTTPDILATFYASLFAPSRLAPSWIGATPDS